MPSTVISSLGHPYPGTWVWDHVNTGAKLKRYFKVKKNQTLKYICKFMNIFKY